VLAHGSELSEGSGQPGLAKILLFHVADKRGPKINFKKVIL
jgi:hypothetical protein